MKYEIVVNGIITRNGEVLIGQKEEVEGHPVSGQFHFPGGQLEEGEQPEETVKREIKEETGLDVEVHQLIDVYTGNEKDNTDGLIRIIFHCEALKGEAKASDDLVDLKWVSTEKLRDKIGRYERKVIENREKVANFIQKLEKMPSI